MVSYIYSITNKFNNKTYVGKTNYPKHRWANHYCAKSLIGSALRKYGKDNFLFQVLEEYQTEEETYEAEQFFIQYLRTMAPFGYNLASGGEGSHAGARHTEETKKKISKAMKGNKYFEGKHHSNETKKKIGEAKRGHRAWNKGLSSSKETKKKISENNGMRGKKHSEETKRKMSEAKKGKHLSEETRKKMTEAKRNISEETKKKISKSNKVYWRKKRKSKTKKQFNWNWRSIKSW